MGFARGPQIEREGLVLYLDAANKKSYPGTGDMWKDLSGNKNDGTAFPGISKGADNKGIIVSDNAQSSGIQLPESINGLPLFTYSTWVRINNETHSYNYLFSNARDCCDTFEGIDIRVGGTRVIYRVWNGTTSSTNLNGSYLEVGVWYHLSFLYDGESLILYQNGEFYDDRVHVGQFTNPTFPLFIGRMGYSANYRLDGDLSLPMIYNRAITQEQNKNNFNATKSRFGL